MALTLATAEAQYLDNLDYTGDTTKMKLALEALRAIRMLRGQSMGNSGSNITFANYDSEIAMLEKELNRSERGMFSKARAVME